MEAGRKVSILRLDQTQLDIIEKEVSIAPTIPKTELEAGFALGVQFVLRKLKDGFTVTQAR